MATQIWRPKALAVAEVVTVTVGGTLSSETFQLKLGGVVIAEHTDTDTVIATTVAALVAAWNASTHPWATAVTAVDASPNITLTADTAGVPFGAHLNRTTGGQTFETGVYGYYEIGLNTPGGSATLTQVETTANRGPNCANVGENWSTDNILADGDDVRIENNGIDIKWGLNMTLEVNTGDEIVLNSLHAQRSYIGKIGLDSATFDGLTTAPEYRETYWGIRVDAANGDVRIGEQVGPGISAGSRRIMLDLKGDGANIIAFGSHSQAFDSGRPAVRILCDGVDGDSEVVVYGAEGGFGIAMDKSGETSRLAQFSIECPSTKHKVFTSSGFGTKDGNSIVQMTGGYCKLRHVPTTDGATNLLAKVSASGGELWIDGDTEITLLENSGALLYPNNYSSFTGNKAIGTFDGFAGTTDTTKSTKSRTWDVVNHYEKTHKLLGKGTVVTMTTFNNLFTTAGGAGGGNPVGRSSG